MADGLDLQELDDFLHHFPMDNLFAPGGTEVEERLCQVRAHVHVAAHHQVLDHRHSGENVRALKGPGQALARDFVDRHVANAQPA